MVTKDEREQYRDGHIKWLLSNRDNSRVMSALKRGGVQATETTALPFLLPELGKYRYLAKPALLHASDFATFRYLRHVEGRSLGGLLKELVNKGVIAENSLERVLMAVQVSDLTNAHTMWQGKLAMANNNSLALDWGSLWDLYVNWDNPRYPDSQRRTRRSLLEDYYS
jgi:CRISPR type I-E-associated protein CasB/Cse2